MQHEPGHHGRNEADGDGDQRQQERVRGQRGGRDGQQPAEAERCREERRQRMTFDLRAGGAHRWLPSCRATAARPSAVVARPPSVRRGAPVCDRVRPQALGRVCTDFRRGTAPMRGRGGDRRLGARRRTIRPIPRGSGHDDLRRHGASPARRPTIGRSGIERPARQQLASVAWFAGLSLGLAVFAFAAGTPAPLLPFILAIGPTVIALGHRLARGRWRRSARCSTR